MPRPKKGGYFRPFPRDAERGRCALFLTCSSFYEISQDNEKRVLLCPLPTQFLCIVSVKIKEKRVEAKGEVLDYSSWMKKGEGVLCP